jgi:glycosyltransferase involved in cell wall biosynthesis
VRHDAERGHLERAIESPEYSIILPTRDRPHLVAEAIASVVAQTNPSWELIVVDDNGDVPVEAPTDPRITIVRRSSTGGPAAARNTGLSHARGRYVGFLDDDDLFEPDRLAVASMHRTHHPVTVCGTRFLGERTGSIRRLEGDVSDVILDGPTASLGATIVLRSLCPRFDERWLGVEDVEWWMRLTRVATVHTIAHIGYVVRRHDGLRYLNDRRRRIDDNLALLDEQKAWFDAHPAAAAHRWKRIGIMAETLGDHGLARHAYRRSHTLAPSATTRWHRMRMTAPVAVRAPMRTAVGVLRRRIASPSPVDVMSTAADGARAGGAGWASADDQRRDRPNPATVIGTAAAP